MLPILIAVKKWSVYLLGRQFFIKTDNHSLKFLLDQSTKTPAQQKWVFKMMGYDFKLVYREGIHNIVVDALSRGHYIELQALFVFQTNLLNMIKKSWLQYPTIIHLIQNTKASTEGSNKYTRIADQLRRKGKIVIGKDLSL